jgi:DNA-binding MarR family transcriptional regulator
MNKEDNERLIGICRKVDNSCMGMRVRRAARVVGNYYDVHLKSVGLKGTQFTLLNAIFLNPSITITQLADLLLLNRTTLNRNLKPLERQGLVRTSPGKDQRTRVLKLTQEGQSILKRTLPSWLEAQSGVVELLGMRMQRLTEDLNELEKLEIQSEK